MVLIYSLLVFRSFALKKDSLSYYAERSENSSLRKAAIIEIEKNIFTDQRAYYYLALSYKLENSKIALLKLDSIIDLVKPYPNSIWRERLQALRISFLRKNGMHQKSIDQGKILLEVFLDSNSIFDVSRVISISYRRINKYDSALIWALRIQKQAELLNDDLRLHRALQNRANLYDVLKQRAKAIKLERQLLTIADRLENSDLQVLDRCNLGSSFVNLNVLDSAKFYFEQALQLAERWQNIKRIPLILYNMGSLEYKHDKYENCVELLIKCLEYAEKTVQPSIISSSHYLLALCYLNIGDFTKVHYQIKVGLSEASKYGFLQDKLYFLELLTEIQNRNNNYEGVISTLQSIRILEDSIMNQERIKTIEELETKYETEKKERHIKNLEQEALIADLRIKQQNFQLLAVLLIFISGSITGYFLYRTRALKVEKHRLMMQQRLLRTQMNPHFLFNALSSVHGYIYEGDQKQAAEYLSMFGTLTRDILDHSQKELISMQKELDVLEMYVNIQKIRFPWIVYNIQIDRDLDINDMQIPPMLIQPFVENCIEHGFRGKHEGRVEVEILKVCDDKLVIFIRDNGVGLEHVKGQNYQSKAFEIAKERLSLLSGMKKNTKNLTIDNRSGTSGVVVEIKLPIIELI